MVFSLGNLLVIGIVLVILALYRALDKNNRSLDKVRKYADKVREDLDSVVLEKVQDLKDLAIELEVHQKAGKEVLKRIQGIEDGIKDKFSATENISARIKEYDRVLDELVGMTRRAEENIGRVKEESEFTDSVAKKIRVIAAKLDEQEARIPEIIQKFQEKNAASLAGTEEKLTAFTNSRVESVENRVADAMAKADSIELFLKSSEGRNREYAEALAADLNRKGDDLVELVNEKLAALESSYYERLEEAARKGESLETKALVKLKEHIEEKLKILSRELSAQIEAGKAELEKNLVGLDSLVAAAHEEAGRDIATIKDENTASLLEFRTTIRDKLDDLEGTLYQAEQAFQEKISEVNEKGSQAIDTLENKINQNIETKTEGLTADMDLRLAALRQNSVASQEKIEEMFSGLEEKADAWTERLEETVNTVQSQIATLGTMKEKIETVKTEGEELSEKVLERCRAIAQENDARIQEDLEKAKLEMGRIEALQTSAAERMNEVKTALTSESRNLDTQLRQFVQDYETKILKTGESLETRIITDLDARLQEYEKNITYRFTRIEEVSSEIDNLENSLRQTMERISLRLREDFTNFGKDLHERRLEDKAELEKGMDELRGAMDELERGLSELKTRAYDNVSEKLKIFEDEFFQDLKSRDQIMQAKFMEWQGKLDSSLDTLAQEGLEERSRIEGRYSSELSSLLQEFQLRVTANLENLDTQVEGFRKNVSERIGSSENAVKQFQVTMKADIEEMKSSSRDLFQEEFSRQQEMLGSEVEGFEKDYELRLKTLSEDFDERKREFSGLLDGIRSDVTLWQAKVLQDLKTSEADVTNQFAGFKVQVSGTISSLRDEFTNQKNDLITASDEERRRLKDELKSLSEQVAALEESLKKKTEEALDGFRSEYGDFQEEYNKKNKDIQAEADQKIRDFRHIVGDTREQFDALHQKLFGKLEESAKLLSLNLTEIDKKQKGFIEQTKIFERADTLKISLQENIEELKNDIAKVETQRKEIRETENLFLRLKKLGEEANDKMTRFVAEKRRLDSLDEDFKKLIGMSEGIEQKVRQISASDDGIQAIQASLRSLETLQQDVDVRFERLEKKRKFLDLTTEGVDKNFQSLQTIEKKILSIEEEIDGLPDRIDTLSERLRGLSAGKEQADKTVEKLAGLDSLMKDIEDRMENLQKAREWLARTETRIEEVSREAQDQVKLLGSLLKEGSKTAGKKEKGAPSLSARDTVTKLAHQGWTVEQIAMATKLSRGEVELILELTGK